MSRSKSNADSESSVNCVLGVLSVKFVLSLNLSSQISLAVKNKRRSGPLSLSVVLGVLSYCELSICEIFFLSATPMIGSLVMSHNISTL